MDRQASFNSSLEAQQLREPPMSTLQHDINRQGFWIALALATCILIGINLLKRNVPFRVKPGSHFPPVVHLTKEEQFKDPINSYNKALRNYGDIIAVPKKDKLEIIVSEKYVTKVLTDESNFSFEQGVADAMNFDFLMTATDSKIFKIMAEVTSELLSKRMDIVVQQVSCIFLSRAAELAESADSNPVDLFEYCQSTVSDAMVVLLLGKKFLNRANSNAIKLAANDVAELGGIFQNRSYFARTFPPLWRFVTWLKVVIGRILFGLFLFLGRPIWSEMTRLAQDPKTYKEADDVTLLSLLVKKYATPERTLRIGDRGTIYLVLIATMFASVHQVASTMVWVMCELALRPRDQDDIMDEINRLRQPDTETLNHDHLKNAVLTDSFIREVMRTKGDTFSTVRMAINNVQLGNYIIPKGYTVHPNASLAHNDPARAGEKPEIFYARRWLERGKPAAMTGPGHLAFGLGRWACPGRFFAVAEIKMMVISMLSNMKLELVGNRYNVVDKLMIASAPPEAYFKLTKRACESKRNATQA
ncbi:cytochrome P450 [Metarhizium rileyi]|uniref:Cytochrome P450 n=1 Tax=Metarhizium rileyi (strain RCEF 4871) TaxID=1649241 RepID=A0A167A4E5_METRR|nr:cytochrome P450 [Metarhizium rileyi RCEF 4871]